ncbi:outer membrane protein assembly factor BamA [Hoeflea prorocentri]|uniref:Outer membrane protein assembly factor BamA n=1 Tax=Hoeflea prorocentri TaxID=1922333 RepID=A0A9X3ZH61_9HYPH|nr:outer membrane protein assembly factor BamA [Hoeflea prorocentri]MCY6380939.1 outer membrane protein assembly factor BamA [Hoeflea prorocentri]MDA5398739.1 outer membrane protein assembly factor BamA [Hoeflea prorocentri]
MKAGSKLLGALSALALSMCVVLSGAGAAFLASAVTAQAAVVNTIDVRGNQRVDADTIRGNMTIKPGVNFTNVDIDESIKQLFATGLFSDVRIDQRGRVLIVTVDENLIINQIVFNGNKKIKDKQLEAIVQSRPLGPYSETTIEYDADAIREAYDRIGRSDATVTTQVVNLNGGRVNVAFDISEGGRTKITSINFVGNKAYSNGRLADVINTKRSGILSFLSRKDVYDPDKLRADEELLRRFYYNRGFADFRIISSSADLDPASGDYVITITLDEGERYSFGDIEVESTVAGIDAEAVRRHLASRKGAVYSAEKVEDSIISISEAAAADGYPFAQVTPRGNRDFANRTISVTYLIDQGQRAYIERIEIRGNTRTADYVIRREFDISEGDAFNQVLIRRAKRRLEGLGYFQSVNITTQPGSEPDRVVIIVDVKDQATGEFSIGAGYSTGTSGATAELGISERNFLGRGQFIKVAVGGGVDTRTYRFSFTEPYFLGYRLAAGFDVAKTEDTSQDDYDIETLGVTFRVAAPITDRLRTVVAYNYSREEYDPETGATFSAPIQDAINNSPWVKSSISNSLIFDTIDDKRLPREGIFARMTGEFAGLGGDAKFVKFTARGSYYHPISEYGDIIGMLSAGGGYVASTSGDLRVFDQLFIGGETIRGFESQGIGPRDTNGDALGGTTYFNATAEVGFPVPVLPRDFGLRGAVFADAATLYGTDLNLGGATVNGLDMQWRASVGGSVIWSSPFGPFRIDFGFPIAKESFDKTQTFRFGTAGKF